jgi:hypothetical protein
MKRSPHRRALLIVALFAGAVAVLFWGGVGVLLYPMVRSDAYPGATAIGDETLTRFTPNLAVKRTASYRTTDPFPKVYNWYSTGLDLGPETFAQGACILMARSFKTLWVLERQTSVMLCDTPGDRMVFVMRTLIVRLPRITLPSM